MAAPEVATENEFPAQPNVDRFGFGSGEDCAVAACTVCVPD